MGVRVAAISLVVPLLFGCAADDTSDEAADDTAPQSSSPGASSTAGDASQDAQASPLEGVWHTGVVTPDDAMASLQAAGLQQYAQGFFDFWKIGKENVFTLRISGGRWACYLAKDGGLSEEEDSGTYAIDGGTVTIQHDHGTDTHQWSVRGDTLTITYLSDTFTDDSNEEEVYQRVIYMSAPFTRGHA